MPCRRNRGLWDLSDLSAARLIVFAEDEGGGTDSRMYGSWLLQSNRTGVEVRVWQCNLE